METESNHTPLNSSSLPSVDQAAEAPELVKISTANTFLPESGRVRYFNKAVQVIHSYPVGGVEVSTLARRVMNALYIHVQQTFKRLPESDREMIKAMRGTPIFRIQISRLASMVEFEGYAQQRIYEALNAILEWKFKFNLMGDVSGEIKVIEEVVSRILTRLGDGRNERTGEISFELQHDVLMMILEPKPFTQIDMMVVNNVGTHAIALYENCLRYLGTKNKVTAIMPVDTWIAIISGEGNYKGAYPSFKNLVLKKAMLVLNTVASVPFTVELREIKGPRGKVVALQFKMELKKQPSLDFDDQPISWSSQTLNLLKDVYKLNKSDINELSRRATEEEIIEAMRREGPMFAKKLNSSEPVKNRGEYLGGVLNNVQKGKPKDAEPEDEEVDVLAKEVQQALERSQKLKQEFRLFQLKRITERLEYLNKEKFELIRDDFFSQKSSNQTIMESVEKGGLVPSNKVLYLSFIDWVLEQETYSKELLKSPEERDFSIWSELNRGSK